MGSSCEFCGYIFMDKNSLVLNRMFCLLPGMYGIMMRAANGESGFFAGDDGQGCFLSNERTSIVRALRKRDMQAIFSNDEV